MKAFYFLFILIISFLTYSCGGKKKSLEKLHPNTITTSTHDFKPSELNCSIGDSVFFILGTSHDMIEVSEMNFYKNTPYPIKDGFNLGFGKSSFFVPKEIKSHYFVCATHLPKMKLIINVIN